MSLNSNELHPDGGGASQLEFLKYLQGFLEQVATDGIMPSHAWFEESAKELQILLSTIPPQPQPDKQAFDPPGVAPPPSGGWQPPIEKKDEDV